MFLDLSHMFYPKPHEGVIGAPHLLLFPFVKTISQTFPTMRHCWGVVDYRRDVKKKRKNGLQERRKKKKERKKRKKEKRKRIKQRNHNYGIKEHDISYLDTKNKISLKMFLVFIPFRRQFGPPEVFFPWASACAWNCMVPLSSCWFTFIFVFLASSFFHFFFLFPCFSSFLSLSLFLFLFLSLFLFLAPPLVTPEGPGPQSPSPDTPLPLCSLYPPVSLCLLFFFVLSSRKFQPILQKVGSRGRCCLLTFLSYFFLIFPPNKHPPMPCRYMTFSSLEPLLALETAWHPSRPFLRQFDAPDLFFHRGPACTLNCMAHLSSFSPSIWRPWRFLPWSPCLHLKLHGAPLVLFSVNLAPLTFSAWRIFRSFSVNLAPLTFSSLEPLLALETAWRPLSSFSPSIWRPWHFLPWSLCLHLKLHGALLVLFSVNLAPLTFSSLEALLAL